MFGLGHILLAAIIVGTWNGNWFPSGRAEHRANAEVEDATITAAAKMLAKGLKAVDPEGTNEVILCLNEMRGPKVVSNLVERIGRKDLKPVAVSAYRRRDRFDYQQDAIATTLPIASSGWSRWRIAGKQTPPRGFAFAAVIIDPATTANVYAVHLKSNYGATTKEIAEANRNKRTESISQLLQIEKPKRGRKKSRPVIIVGDMNADKWNNEPEQMFNLLAEVGFKTPLENLPSNERWTHPSKRYGNSTLDYVFQRGFEDGAVVLVDSDELSDHRALFAVLQVDK